MDPNWGDYWVKSRAIGRTQFVLRRGIVLGLVMFGLMVLIPRLFSMVEHTDLPIVAFIGFMLAGFAFAALLWWANERSYLKLQKSQDQQEKQDQPEQQNDN